MAFPPVLPAAATAGRSGAGLLLTGAVACTLTADVVAGPGFSPLARPLSELFWTAGGWLFPLALTLLAGGLLLVAGSVGVCSRSAAAGFGAAAAAALVAALFPADGPGSGSLSGAGETHRWASLVLLVLPLGAGGLLTRRCRGLRTELFR